MRTSLLASSIASLACLSSSVLAAKNLISSPTTAASTFDCKHVKAGNYQFDLSPIQFPVTILSKEDTPPTITKTSIAIDLCAPLAQDSGPSNEECPKGTRICMKVSNEKSGEKERVIQVIPAGGTETDENDWSARLGEHIGSAERVLELEVYGDYYGDRKQRTEIDLRCDKNAAKDSLPTLKKYDRLEGKLKLDWTTPHACASHMGGAGDDEDEKNRNGKTGGSPANSGGWGIFSWFFFFVFVGGLVYLAAGLWRNYNEYGVIELPNKDFWREAPYIAKDMGRHIYSTVSGQGSSRGAYEPV